MGIEAQVYKDSARLSIKRKFNALTGTVPILSNEKGRTGVVGYKEMTQEQRDLLDRPDSNLGILLGPSKKVGVNSDIPLALYEFDFEYGADAKTFFSKWDDLCKQTLIVRTPHGGYHVFFLSAQVSGNKQHVFGEDHLVDILAAGITPAPTSKIDHAECGENKPCKHTGIGEYYRISSGYDVMETFFNEGFWPWVENRAKALGWKMNRKAFQPLDEDKLLTEGIPNHTRNERLFDLSKKYIKRWWPDENKAWMDINVANSYCLPKPLDKIELKTTFNSAKRSVASQIKNNKWLVPEEWKRKKSDERTEEFARVYSEVMNK